MTVPNRAPSAVGALDVVRLLTGEPRPVWVELSGAFSDPDGDGLGYTAAAADPALLTLKVAGSGVWVQARRRGSTTVTVST